MAKSARRRGPKASRAAEGLRAPEAVSQPPFTYDNNDRLIQELAARGVEVGEPHKGRGEPDPTKAYFINLGDLLAMAERQPDGNQIASAALEAAFPALPDIIAREQRTARAILAARGLPTCDEPVVIKPDGNWISKAQYQADLKPGLEDDAFLQGKLPTVLGLSLALSEVDTPEFFAAEILRLIDQQLAAVRQIQAGFFLEHNLAHCLSDAASCSGTQRIPSLVARRRRS